MKLLSERLKWAMAEKQIRDNVKVIPADIARAAKAAAASANFWFNDVNGMSAKKARMIGEFLGVDAIWLETGLGEPFPKVVTDSKPEDFVTPRRRSTDHDPVLSKVTAIHPDDPQPKDVFYVPESRIEFSAGNGRTAHFELVEDEEPASYRLSWFQKYGINPNRVRRFRVSGDSMEPAMYARDTILVNMDETNIVDGKTYAIRYGDELRVKKLYRRLDGTVVLRSVNPAYKDEEVPPELVSEHITVIGRVRDRSGTGGL